MFGMCFGCGYYDAVYIEPAAGSVEQGVQVRATFQHAFLNYMDVNHDGVVRTTAVPLQLKGCRGANITSRRCIRVLVEQAGMLHVAFPPNPLGLPAQLENTWMEVVYF